jgi:hypothetical protein
MKRKDTNDLPKGTNSLAKGRKKQRKTLEEVESVYDQSKQYWLATVKFLIDALTPE